MVKPDRTVIEYIYDDLHCHIRKSLTNKEQPYSIEIYIIRSGSKIYNTTLYNIKTTQIVDTMIDFCIGKRGPYKNSKIIWRY